MSRKKVCIVIPVYKANPADSEVKSLMQCLKILEKHPVSLICGKSQDISFYESIGSKLGKHIKFIRFKDEYFSSIQGYNRLMLASEFYKRFKDFEYILLYQLDAWVFRDELDNWCQKGFDYIGAPWFWDWHLADVEAKIVGVGNGGFSLRKVKKTSQLIRKMNLMKFLLILYNLIIKFLPVLKKYKRIIETENLLNKTQAGLKNEDYHIMVLSQVFKGFHIAPSNIALSFSFESNPVKLFEMNKGLLPFGCHGWIRYEKEFWEKYIR